ncbi:hypothetical protein MMC07_006901 [Pseudocyphellaria aurata]|nr:hypothetical protein [Pseudocyphellaria aurata]
MGKLHDVLPDNTPAPIATGSYAADPDVHFILSEFIEMSDDLPDHNKMALTLFKLHNTGISPNGKYGFPVPTFQGTFAQYTEWTDSWEDFFTKSFKLVMSNEKESQGFDLEMQELCQATIKKVIPRLLRPLETGGRNIQPRLVHGDLWVENLSTNTKTGDPVIFDATCIYAHNEIELAPWRPARHRMEDSYVEAYFKHFEPSDPREDRDDRNALYCLRWDMNCSSLYPGKLQFRELCKDVMRTLVAKHGLGYESWAKSRGEEPVRGKKMQEHPRL